MLGDFADKLRSIGRLDLLDAVGNEALSYLSKERTNDTEQRALRRAQAYRTIAGAQLTREQFANAKATLTLARQQLQPWLESSRSPELHSLASALAFRLGRISFLADELSVTETYWQEHLREARRVVELSAGPLAGQRELSNALLNLGILETRDGRNHWELATRYLRDSIDIRARLVAAGSQLDRNELANAWAWVANVQAEQGFGLTAEATLQRAIDIVDGGTQLAHSDAARLQLESEIRFEAAMLAADLGRDEQMAAHLLVALDKAAALAAIDSGNLTANRRLAKTALYAFRLLPASAIDGVRWQRSIDDCLSQDMCRKSTQANVQLELDALSLWSRWRADPRVPSNSAFLSNLAALCSIDHPRPMDLLRAVDTAAILRQRAALSDDAVGCLLDSLERVLVARRGSLRFTLAQEGIWALAKPGDERVRALRIEIAARRAADKRPAE